MTLTCARRPGATLVSTRRPATCDPVLRPPSTCNPDLRPPSTCDPALQRAASSGRPLEHTSMALLQRACNLYLATQRTQISTRSLQLGLSLHHRPRWRGPQPGVTLPLPAVTQSGRSTPKAPSVTLTVRRRMCRVMRKALMLATDQPIFDSQPAFLLAIQHHTHTTAPAPAPAPRPASLAAVLKTTKYPRGDPVTTVRKGGSKPLVVKPTVKPTRLPLQQPAQGRLNQWGRSKTNLGNDGLTLSSS